MSRSPTFPPWKKPSLKVGSSWRRIIYIGLGTNGPHPYLIGEGQARSALDSMRALRQMKEVSVTERTVVWGHSQGGNAAMWTGILGPAYASDQKIDGVAAAAPATDLIGLMKNAETSAVGKILSSYILTAYSETYPDVKFSDYATSGAGIIARDMATRCLGGKKALFLVGESVVVGGSIFATDPSQGALGDRLRQNFPVDPISAPLFIAQGSTDELVLPEIQDRFVQGLCSTGRSIEYTKYTGKDHLSVVAKESPLTADLIQWTRDRFENKTAPQGCSKKNT